MRAKEVNARADGRTAVPVSAYGVVAAVRLRWLFASGLWPALTFDLWPLTCVPGLAATGTQNNRRNSHDLFAFRIEETLKFDAKRSF
jgi:hypothetical protein